MNLYIVVIVKVEDEKYYFMSALTAAHSEQEAVNVINSIHLPDLPEEELHKYSGYANQVDIASLQKVLALIESENENKN